MSKKLSKTIILINHCIRWLLPSQFLNLPQSRLPTLPEIGFHHQPVVEALSSGHAPASTTVCMLEDAFITSCCTGHVTAPQKSPCMCLFAFPQAVWFCGERLSKVCSDAWDRSSPCHLHCLGSKPPDVCTRSSHHSALGMSLAQTKSVHVAVCFPTGRLILRRASPKGLFWCIGSKLPLPSSLFGLETSRRLFA